MKQRVQMNIAKDNHMLNYVVEVDDTISTTSGTYSYNIHDGGVQLYRIGSPNAIHTTNTWVPAKTNLNTNFLLPDIIHQKYMRLYMPRYSIESFYDDTFMDGNDLSGLRYALSAYTYVAGVKVTLGCYMFTALDAYATNKPIRYKGNDYMQAVDFLIPDPARLMYDDEWIDFRNQLCGEPLGTNNTGSVINFDLFVLTPLDGVYMETVEFAGCVSAIPFTRSIDGDMRAVMSFDDRLNMELKFNEVYNGDLQLYLQETYNIMEPCKIAYEVIIKDANDIYMAPTPEVMEVTDRRPLYEITHEMFRDNGLLDWTWFLDGMILQGCIYVFRCGADEHTGSFAELMEYNYPVVDCLTNEIPLTKEIFKYLVPRQMGVDKIEFDNINMQEYNVSVVNKLQHNVITINRPEDYKANIIRPVFIRSEKLDDVIIHPAVPESISLNLNQYKSTVEVFYIQIEGVIFAEVGRTNNSVVFQIEGNKLPKEVDSGILYLLNQDKELITTGKFTYEQ